jgi:hypothetical protein
MADAWTPFILVNDGCVTIGRHSLVRRNGKRGRTHHLQRLGIVSRFLKIAAAD